MSSTEQEKIIQKLRSKIKTVEMTTEPKKDKDFDKDEVWKLAKRVGKDFSDDTVFTASS